MNAKSYDIIIVGGGMVGLSLACMLAQKSSLSIAILEAKPSSSIWHTEQYHHRVSAIALSSQRIFQAIGIWDEMRAKRVSRFNKIQVWDAAVQGEINFDCKEIAEANLGYIIENNLIQSLLEERVRQHPHIDIITPVTLTQYTEKELITESGQVYTANLIVAADGANSWLRTQAGIEIKRDDYEQEGIVTTVQTELPHQQTARQVFLETGPLAFLPLSDAHQSSIVWSVPSTDAKRLMILSAEDFQHELARAFEYRLGDVIASEKRFHFPLYKQQAKHYVKPHLALVGDAAHTIHPLAGQGVNMGLLDAASLTDIVMESIAQRRDINLRAYERWRKADNLALMTGVDAIKCLFASDKKTIQQARSLGLNMVNRARWIKNYFSRHAVGDRNGLPTLAR